MASQETSRSRASITAAVMYAVLLTALLYLLIFHLSSGAPMRTGGNRPAALEMSEKLQIQAATGISHAAAGKNVQLHFQMPEDAYSQQAFFFTTVYYRAAYELYPQRVYVGSDDRVINFPTDLKSADRLPSIDWLHEHQVPAVFCFVPGDERGPGGMVYRVP